MRARDSRCGGGSLDCTVAAATRPRAPVSGASGVFYFRPGCSPRAAEGLVLTGPRDAENGFGCDAALVPDPEMGKEAPGSAQRRPERGGAAREEPLGGGLRG